MSDKLENAKMYSQQAGRGEQPEVVPTEVLRLWNEESGQGMAEYALILFLVALACVSGLKVLGDKIPGPIEEVASKLK